MMAIPFHLPSQQEADDYYRILDDLFLQLYEIVRQILLRRRINPVVQPPRNRPPQRRDNEDGGGGGGDGDGGTQPVPQNQEQHAPNNDDATRRVLPDVLPLPDVVLSAITSGAPAARCPTQLPRRPSTDDVSERPQPRRPRRRRNASSRDKKTRGDVATVTRRRENWQQVGKELQKIADEFRAVSPPPLQDQSTQTSQDLHKKKSEESLLSLLVPVPVPFCRSVWTAVIFLVGWRLLVANRGW